ncbi:MAG: prepilin-type N-terminal cleavage/methylation domain-containing protein [Candidatus Paceibacterota bacterium]
MKNSLSKGGKGFTILELIVVLAIFFVITAIVIADIPNFSSKSSLDLTTSEVATYIRGAQVYGASQKGGVAVVYGIHLDSGANSFYLFKNSKATKEETYDITGFKVSAIKISPLQPTPPSSIDVVFKANDYSNVTGTSLEPMVYNNYVGSGSVSIANFISAEITITSDKGSVGSRCIKVYGNGQITIESCS